jgi:hypothetical protein
MPPSPLIHPPTRLGLLMRGVRARPGWCFVLAFVALCSAFVPVLLYFVVFVVVAPISYFVWWILSDYMWGEWKAALFAAWWLSGYLFVYFAIGALVWWAVRKVPWRVARTIILTAVLLLPVAASFARVITHGGLWGRGGTYTFWEAVVRHQERNRGR